MRMAAALFIALLVSIPSAASAEPAPTTMIAPILGQIVGFSLPAGFTLQKEDSNGAQYFRGAFLKGETADTWSQMITITGAKNANIDPTKSAQFIAANIAGDIRKHCPETFSVKPMGPTKIDGQDAFVAIASCGKVKTGAAEHSETALMITIKSAQAIYTIQWAERTPSNAENLTIDEDKWKGRLEKLIPIRVCPIVPGEKAPYPSCVNKK
jgi:hypothetical protein